MQYFSYMLALVLVTFTTVSTAEAPLRLYTMPAIPYSYQNSQGALEGPTIELFNELTKRLGVTGTKVDAVPGKRMAWALKNYENVLIYPFVKRKSRDIIADWTFHVNDDAGNFIALIETPFITEMDSVRTIKDIKGTNIGVIRGSTFEISMKKFGLNPDLLMYSNSAKQGLDQLLAKRTKYLYLSDTVVSEFLKQPAYSGKIKVKEPLVRVNVYIANSKKFDPALLTRVKTTLQTMQKDGSLEKILGKVGLSLPNTIKGLKTANE